MASDLVRVVFRKYDGTLHWNQLSWRLGEDGHGIWLGAPAGTPVRLGHQVREPTAVAHAVLLPRDTWWTAIFNAAPHRTEIYCDITTMPVWADSEVSMVDLDLDVRRRRSGEVQLLDEDEFAAHRVRYGYPAEVVASAEAAAGWLVSALRDGVEPFDKEYHRWLALAEAAQPPTEPPGAG